MYKSTIEKTLSSMCAYDNNYETRYNERYVMNDLEGHRMRTARNCSGKILAGRVLYSL